MSIRSFLAGKRYDPKKIANLGITERQLDLMWRRAWYIGKQYSDRQYNWDGTICENLVDRQAISTGPQDAPPGFVKPVPGDGQQSQRYRKPRAMSTLSRRIVDEFTAHLWGEKTRPKVQVLGNDDLEDYLDGLITASQFWYHLMCARPEGGAIGTACVTFKFQDGVPYIESHDPTWVIPTFKNRADLTLSKLEIRFMFPMDVKVKDKWTVEMMWDRRVIGEDADTYYEPEPVKDGEEPKTWTIKDEVQHNFGFCPAVWIQNLPSVGNDIYGTSDIELLWEQLEEYDVLQSAASQGTIENCDPTLVINSQSTWKEDKIKKGSRHAILFERDPGGRATYLEMTGSGIEMADKRAQALKAEILEGASCVLAIEQMPGNERTATEINRKYGPMWNKIGMLRTCWGARGVQRLLERMVQAIRILNARGEEVKIPPKVTRGQDGEAQIKERVLPDQDGIITLEWPPLDTPTLADAQIAVGVASTALQSGLTTKERAVRYMAPFLGDEDPQATIKTLEEEAEDQRAEMEELQDPEEELEEGAEEG